MFSGIYYHVNGKETLVFVCTVITLPWKAKSPTTGRLVTKSTSCVLPLNNKSYELWYGMQYKLSLLHHDKI